MKSFLPPLNLQRKQPVAFDGWRRARERDTERENPIPDHFVDEETISWELCAESILVIRVHYLWWLNEHTHISTPNMFQFHNWLLLPSHIFHEAGIVVCAHTTKTLDLTKIVTMSLSKWGPFLTIFRIQYISIHFGYGPVHRLTITFIPYIKLKSDVLFHRAQTTGTPIFSCSNKYQRRKHFPSIWNSNIKIYSMNELYESRRDQHKSTLLGGNNQHKTNAPEIKEEIPSKQWEPCLTIIASVINQHEYTRWLVVN